MKSFHLCAGYCFGILLFGTSCGSMAEHSEVDVSIENKSARMIENTQARFGKYECTWGLVSAGANKTYGLYPHPITIETELSWDVGGEHKSQKFDLAATYRQGKSGRLVFVVLDERAYVQFREDRPPK